MSDCKCGYYPTVIVPGIGQSKTDLYSKDGKRVKTVWPMDIDEKELVKKVVPSALKMLVTRKDGELIETLKKAIMEAVDPLRVNGEGTPVYDLRPVDYDGKSVGECDPEDRDYIYRMVPMEELGEIIGEDHLFFFAYNSFGQPYETAAQLHRYIQNVKAKTGHDKVNLVPVSLGGSIATAYLDCYGDRGDIHRICYFVPAVNGSTIIADVLENKVDFSNPAELFEILLGSKTAETICSLEKCLPKDGLLHITNAFLEAAVEVLLGNCPAMWAVVPKERYQALADKLLSGYGKGTLRAKTERFYRAQCNVKELLYAQKKKGVDVFSICGYDRSLPPFIQSKTVNSDSVVDFVSTSLGGTALPLGETFKDDYVSPESNCGKKGHNHISPERTVDLSTSLFPDSVFCFCGQQHDNTAYNDVAMAISCRILTDDSFKGVYSDPKYPQFNGSRNIRRIKYKLLPEAKELLKRNLHETVKKELEESVKEAEAIFEDTFIKNNDNTEKATARLQSAVEAARPDLRV